MTSQPIPAHPDERRYVLSLHRDALARPDRFFGRIEHVASGEHFDFSSTSSLVFWLLQHTPTGETP